MSGRERLLDAALRLMAEQGIDAVPLQVIVETAEQRNASAVHYHFGSRFGLIDAVARRHQARVDELRERMLASALARPEVTLTDLSACMVLPIAAMMDTREHRDGVRVVSQVIIKYGFHTILSADGEGRESLAEMWRAFEAELHDVPVAVRRQRIARVVASQMGAWADRATQIDAGRTPMLSHQQFVADSIAVAAGALSAPAVDMRTLRWAVKLT
ncbi:TetR/AcrR family transcriptional regulator [Cumulibacter soli]|uniref:TetR/AcrR family transcriptional regulator n=1 Tax=Cumulibacter soli TaxID=2546344 RepID=UPI0010680089|nr:helix-turn-helix domain-containing protein [Cumulibacter soli]